MAAYVLSVAGAILISAVFTIIAPAGKMGTFVRGALKLFTVVILISPFVSFFGNGKFPYKSDTIVEDAGYYVSVVGRLTKADEEEISRALKENFGVNAEARVERNPAPSFERKKIAVKISAEGIFGQDPHKDMLDRIQAFLEETYGCPAEVT